MPRDEHDRLKAAAAIAADLSDDELLAYAQAVVEEMQFYRGLIAPLHGEVLRRMSERKATLILAGGWAADRDASNEYTWDIDALEAYVHPLVPAADWPKLVEEVPPPPPPPGPVYKANTARLLALRKRLGDAGAVIDRCYSVQEKVKGVSFRKVDAPPLPPAE